MHTLVAALGAALVAVLLIDVFEVIVLPRRIVHRVRIVVMFYLITWRFWDAVACRLKSPRRRDMFLSIYGPLSLPALLLVWATGCILGFAMLLWGLHAPISGMPPTFGQYLYLSGVTFFTLGYGDVTPLGPVGRLITVIEVGTGFGLLAIVIGYLPVIYQGFSRRETAISLLDARAGSPPTAERLLRRHQRQTIELALLLREWERWSAELLESHISYPVIGYFRSQHNNQSWLTALTAILDACVLVLAVVEDGPAWQAQLTFAMARHAVVDLAQVYRAPPRRDLPDRLPPEALADLAARLTRSGFKLHTEDPTERVRGLRQMYEPYVQGLAGRLFLAVPDWSAPAVSVENWQTSAWDRITGNAIRTYLRDPMDDHD